MIEKVTLDLGSLRFAQAGTEENILLRPLEAHMYAWRTHKAPLQLWLCVEGLGYWRWSEPFSPGGDLKEGQPPLVRKIDHGTHVTTVIVSMRSLAKTSQCQITINGLISTASLLRDTLEVRAVMHRHGAALAASATGLVVTANSIVFSLIFV